MFGSRGIGKLFQFKRWLTLSEGARYLSLVLHESVGVEDILRLGIDGHLILSVRFVNGCKASIGKVIPIREAKHRIIPTFDGKGIIDLLEGVQMRTPDTVVVFDPAIVGISDIWDLTMLGAERIDAERLFQGLTLGPEVDTVNLDGPIVRSGPIYCRLMTRVAQPTADPLKEGSFYDPSDHYPADRLPGDSEIVVRPEALRDFEFRFSEPEPEPEDAPPARVAEAPLAQRERTSLLVMIAALAELAKVDTRRPSSAAVAIEAQTELMGARVAARTIEDHLNRIPDALDRRR